MDSHKRVITTCITKMTKKTSQKRKSYLVVEHLPRDVPDQTKGVPESESDMTEIALVFNPALVRKLRSLFITSFISVRAQIWFLSTPSRLQESAPALDQSTLPRDLSSSSFYLSPDISSLHQRRWSNRGKLQLSYSTSLSSNK